MLLYKPVLAMFQLNPAKISSSGGAKGATEMDLITQKKQQHMQNNMGSQPFMDKSMNTLSSPMAPTPPQNKAASLLENFDKMHNPPLPSRSPTSSTINADDSDDEDNDKPLFGNNSNNSNQTMPDTTSWNPPPKPVSVANEQRIKTENQQIMEAKIQNAPMGYNTLGNTPNSMTTTEAFNIYDAIMQPTNTPSYSGANAYATQKAQDIDLGRYDPQYAPKSHELYIKNMHHPANGSSSMGVPMGPHPHPMSFQMYGGNNNSMGDMDMLMKKVNYLTHLIEKRNDEKTGSATQEVVLYSFLGVFIIYVIDTFTRVGKYTR